VSARNAATESPGGRDFAGVADEPLLEPSRGSLRMKLKTHCIGTPRVRLIAAELG